MKVVLLKKIENELRRVSLNSLLEIQGSQIGLEINKQRQNITIFSVPYSDYRFLSLLEIQYLQGIEMQKSPSINDLTNMVKVIERLNDDQIKFIVNELKDYNWNP